METTIERLQGMEDFTKFKCIDRNNNEHRAMKEDENNIFIYAKGYKTKGYRYDIKYFADNFSVKETNIDKTKQWHNRLKRAIKCMEQSGLWGDLKEKYNNLLKITYDEKQDIYKHSIYYNFDLSSEEEKTIAEESARTLLEKNNQQDDYFEIVRRKKIALQEQKYKDYIQQLKNKYNFMIKTNNDTQEDYIDTDYIHDLSECKLKSMYFGKYRNKYEKETIKQKIENKQDYSNWTRTNYDTSFEYRAKDNRAWYSEEYKGCGNGHYYLALDHNTALFCEND